MVLDQSFESYHKQIAIMTQVIAMSRRSHDLKDREARLRAACECAELSLKRDLEAIIELERNFDRLNSNVSSHRT